MSITYTKISSDHLLQTVAHASAKLQLLGSATEEFREQPQLSYCIPSPTHLSSLGSGGFSIVYKANDLKSGQVVALKKSRVSLKVKRPNLQYESRILQMLQGHPAIPVLYGYGQLVHFEYMSMELLGDNVRDKAPGALTVISVVRIVEQALSALEHVHKHGLVHRDIKPENLLCSINDPSKIVLVDFGLTKCTTLGPPKTYDPIKEKKCIVGTLYFASLNSHHGIDLAPGDDIESLAYTALFLLEGILPWRNLISPDVRWSQPRVHESKAAFSGSQLFTCFPEDFAYLLDHGRGLGYHQMPDYGNLESRFSRLVETLGGYLKGDPIDWTFVPVDKPNSKGLEKRNLDHVHYTNSEGDEEDDDSYYEMDYDAWCDRRQRSRDTNLTLSADMEESADSQIPRIIDVSPRFY